jgi:heptaprenyl diphosphate synthase
MTPSMRSPETDLHHRTDTKEAGRHTARHGHQGAADRRLRTRQITVAAVFAVLALLMSYLEFLIPISIGVPGVKLGLANLIILIALYEMGLRWAALINLVRILLAGLLFTGVFAMLYSLAGAFISLLLMWTLMKSGRFSMIGVSMAGGVAHNFAQLLVAALIVETAQMFLYFPVLLFSGIAAGIAMGIIALIIDRRLAKTVFRSRPLS